VGAHLAPCLLLRTEMQLSHTTSPIRRWDLEDEVSVV
jgi:hypothetical protein